WSGGWGRVALDGVEVVQLAIGDEDVKAPRRILEALDEVLDRRQQLRPSAEVLRGAEDMAFRLLGAEVADLLDLRAARPDGPVDAGRSAVGVEFARQVRTDLLRHRRDLILRGGLFLAAEQGGEEPATTLLFDAVEAAHRAGAVQGDAGLRSLAARLHEDGRHHAHLAAGGRVDVHLTKRLDDTFQLRHESDSMLRMSGLVNRPNFRPERHTLLTHSGKQDDEMMLWHWGLDDLEPANGPLEQ